MDCGVGVCAGEVDKQSMEHHEVSGLRHSLVVNLSNGSFFPLLNVLAVILNEKVLRATASPACVEPT